MRDILLFLFIGWDKVYFGMLLPPPLPLLAFRVFRCHVHLMQLPVLIRQKIWWTEGKGCCMRCTGTGERQGRRGCWLRQMHGRRGWRGRRGGWTGERQRRRGCWLRQRHGWRGRRGGWTGERQRRRGCWLRQRHGRRGGWTGERQRRRGYWLRQRHGRTGEGVEGWLDWGEAGECLDLKAKVVVMLILVLLVDYCIGCISTCGARDCHFCWSSGCIVDTGTCCLCVWPGNGCAEHHMTDMSFGTLHIYILLSLIFRTTGSSLRGVLFRNGSVSAYCLYGWMPFRTLHKGTWSGI